MFKIGNLQINFGDLFTQLSHVLTMVLSGAVGIGLADHTVVGNFLTSVGNLGTDVSGVVANGTALVTSSLGLLHGIGWTGVATGLLALIFHNSNPAPAPATTAAAPAAPAPASMVQ